MSEMFDKSQMSEMIDVPAGCMCTTKKKSWDRCDFVLLLTYALEKIKQKTFMYKFKLRIDLDFFFQFE